MRSARHTKSVAMALFKLDLSYLPAIHPEKSSDIWKTRRQTRTQALFCVEDCSLNVVTRQIPRTSNLDIPLKPFFTLMPAQIAKKGTFSDPLSSALITEILNSALCICRFNFSQNFRYNHPISIKRTLWPFTAFLKQKNLRYYSVIAKTWPSRNINKTLHHWR